MSPISRGRLALVAICLFSPLADRMVHYAPQYDGMRDAEFLRGTSAGDYATDRLGQLLPASRRGSVNCALGVAWNLATVSHWTSA
jgi:hypothetical protein